MSDERMILTQLERAVEEDRVILSIWEQNFIESIKQQLADGRSLSPKQDLILLRLWKRSL